MPKNILWLASYPKSGNTWIRLFLFNYLFNLDRPAPINQAHRLGPSDASAALYSKLAKGVADLQDQSVSLRLRHSVIAALSANGADVNFMKTHCVNAAIEGVTLIPPEITRGAIYIIRNPLDLVLSYADHYGMNHDIASQAIGSDTNVVLPDKTVVHQYLGSWSKHISSWADTAEFKVCVLRYEDMRSDPVTAFTTALDYIGAPVDEQRLARSIQFSSFDEAKRQEAEFGFIEKPAAATQFFRSGLIGKGRELLPQSAIDRIVADHGKMMKRYGYLE